MKKVILTLLVLGTLGGGAYWYLRAPRRASLSEKQITFGQVQKTPMRDVVSANGVVHIPELLVISADVPGQIEALISEVNAVVKPGDLLAKLDARRGNLLVEEARNQVKTAEAAKDQAQSVYDAAEKAKQTQIELEKQGGFRAEREQAEALAKSALAGIAVAEAKVESAKTGLKQALLALEQLEIRVPKDMSHSRWLILERKAQAGQMVGPQAGPLFMLTPGLETVEIHAQVAEGDIAKIREGLQAFFTVSTFSGEEKEIVGQVKKIRYLANNAKGAVYYDTIIEVVNQKDTDSGQWLLRPGMNVGVDVVRSEHADVWRVPSGALGLKMDGAYQSDEVRARVAQWKQKTDTGGWLAVWTWDGERKEVRPLFVRIGGVDKNGQPGMKDSEGNEILEWEPGFVPTPNLRVILKVPPAKAPGIFDQPANLKMA